MALKGKKDVLTRFKVMPEFLDDGTHVSGIVWNFLDFAPDEGPLFQTTTKVGDSQWSGRPMTPAILTEKLQRALADDRLGLARQALGQNPEKNLSPRLALGDG